MLILNNLYNDLYPILKYKTYSKTGVVFNANTYTDVSFTLSAPSGYQFICVMNFHHYGYNGSYPADALCLEYLNVNSTNLMFGFYNASSKITKDVNATALFIKSSCISN